MAIWNKFFKNRNLDEAQQIARIVVQETNQILSTYQINLENRINELKGQIHQLDSKIDLIEKKLATKEIKDKQEYGHLKYQLNAIKNNEV